jgi:glycogen debranching enzyme
MATHPHPHAQGPGHPGTRSGAHDAPAEPFEILIEGGLADDRTLVTVHGDTFGMFDRLGDILPPHLGRHGLFHEGTRYLSRLQLAMWRTRPALLSSSVREEDGMLVVHLTNPDIRAEGAWSMIRHSVHLERRIRLEDGLCTMDLTLRSYGRDRLVLPLDLHFGADFTDIFEVRGAIRPRRGTLLPAEIGTDSVRLRYLGLDHAERAMRLRFSMPPLAAHASCLRYEILLEPDTTVPLSFTVECQTTHPPRDHPIRREAPPPDLWRGEVSASQAGFDAWLRRSYSDLAMMTTCTTHGPFPYAGVPWFATPFGRDSLITAYEVLWLAPGMARGVLRFLAAHQALEDDPSRDAEPGKILHEMRAGEMAALGEVPFGLYYGSVDATPWFLILAAAYLERTGDHDLVRDLWPALERALGWMDGPGDPDGDGFLEYRRRAPKGLVNQGWRDSSDANMHADGSLAEGPLALCEVQAYAYAARLGMAQVARALGHGDVADRETRRAGDLRRAFQKAYWQESLGTYALALDGNKRPCAVRSSSAGHALFTGIASEEQARVLAQTLLSGDHFSGWGICTLARSAVRFNPMSYHNGSVWPHDNALIGFGLARHGHTAGVERILTALFEASRSLEASRLPELMCGFQRQQGEAPTLYPVACSPQAWAAGSVFLLLQALLGLTIHAESRQVRLNRPRLPPFLNALTIRHLRVGEGEIDLLFERADGEVVVRVLRRTAALDLVMTS